MNIIIMGAGEIGLHLAETLSGEDHRICVIEQDEKLAREVDEKLDVRMIAADGASVTVLEEADVADCDLFLGLTSIDTTNLVGASLAKALGAKKTIARIHGYIQREEWLFDYRAHFHIDHLFSSERLAAIELAKFIRSPDAILVEEIGRGKIELQQMRVVENSPAAGKTLLDLAFPPRVRVGAIVRGEKTIIPSATEVILPGDLLTLFGDTNKLTSVVSMLHPARRDTREVNVVIFGGSEYGFALAQMLEAGNFRVRIIEEDEKLCQNLSHTLQKTVVINGDATSLRQLKEEQVGSADFFVAATRDDEDNMMTCLQAKHLGTRFCLTLVHRADYAEAISRSSSGLGILGAVSPRVATSRDLVRYVTSDRLKTLLALDGGGEVVEVAVPAASKVIDKRICEVEWPAGSGLVARFHGQRVTVPAAEDVIAAGDMLIAIVSAEAKKPFGKLVLG